MTYQLLLLLHILSAILVLGSGGGSAIYKFLSDRSENIQIINHTNKIVVIFDYVITLPAIILQFITGFLLVYNLSIPIYTDWLIHSIYLYIFAGILWIIAVFIQNRMYKLSQEAKNKQISLDLRYIKLVKYWTILGFFSFCSMIYILKLMIFK